MREYQSSCFEYQPYLIHHRIVECVFTTEIRINNFLYVFIYLLASHSAFLVIVIPSRKVNQENKVMWANAKHKVIVAEFSKYECALPSPLYLCFRLFLRLHFWPRFSPHLYNHYLVSGSFFLSSKPFIPLSKLIYFWKKSTIQFLSIGIFEVKSTSKFYMKLKKKDENQHWEHI